MVINLFSVPGSPSNLQGTPYGNDRVVLAWNAPDEINGAILNYRLYYNNMVLVKK